MEDTPMIDRRIAHARSLAILLGAVSCCLVPSLVYGQASIAGLVRDASGGVLPGVTVEASSPVLIERVRTVATDGTGQYRIVDLRPGTYTVTFTLAGFSTVRREGVALEGAFTASVSADLRVGSLEETITVTGESPIVDVQNTRRQQILDNETVNAIPSGRAYHNVAALVPGVTVSSTQDVGGIAGPATVTFSIHGGRGSEGRLQVDGMGAGAALGGAGVSFYVPDLGNAEEVTFTTSGGLGEAEVGGPVMSVVPRTGGNTIRGSFFANGASAGMQSDNFTQELRDAGLTLPATLRKIWDVNGSVGGPVRKDRLWYFLASRYQGNRRDVTNMFYNRNAGNPNAWTYDPDLARPAFNDGTWKNASLRLTWQISPSNKLNLFWDEQNTCVNCLGGGTPTASPEAAGGTTDTNILRMQQATWSSPKTNRLLLEAGLGIVHAKYGSERLGNPRDLVRVTEQAGLIPGLTYRSADYTQGQIAFAPRWRASASYITGAHSLKIGYEGQYLASDLKSFTNTQALSYRFNTGVPNQLTMSALPTVIRTRTRGLALYAQEQWTAGRVTLQGGLRYDRAWSGFPQQQVGPQRFVPAFVFPEQDGVTGFNDLSARSGVVYDVFGNARTAIKVNVGRYLEALQSGSRYTATNPMNRVALTTNRAWTDANRDYVADCDLMSPIAQDLRAGGGDFCGAWSNVNFARPVFETSFDPALLGGWGVRPDDWGLGASVQHEILPRASVEVGYHRRWFGKQQVTDNRAVSISDVDRFSVTAPIDGRLPNGGGHVVADLFDVRPGRFGQADNYVTAARTYAPQLEYWHGVDINVNLRVLRGLTFQGGTSTGRRVADQCDIRALLPETTLLNPYCEVVYPFQTQLKGLASYLVPKVDVMVSGTLQSVPGPELAANWVVSNALVMPTLGRSLSGGAANVTVNLVRPGTLFGQRINQLDLRIAKVLRFGARQANLGIDIYNALNSSVVQTYNLTFGPNWLTPTLVMPARFMKVSAQMTF
jgi:hypothetical protein